MVVTFIKTDSLLTEFAGMFPIVDYTHSLGLTQFIKKQFLSFERSMDQFSNEQLFLGLILGSICAGPFFSDLSRFFLDPGVLQVLGLKHAPDRSTILKRLDRISEISKESLSKTIQRWCLHQFVCQKNLFGSHHKYRIVDIDSTINPAYGHQDGVTSTYATHKSGKNGLHGIHAFDFNTNFHFFGEIRPGNTDSPQGTEEIVDEICEAFWSQDRKKPIVFRMDSAFAESKYLNHIHEKGAKFLTKLQSNKVLVRLARQNPHWKKTRMKAANGAVIYVAYLPYVNPKWSGNYRVCVYRFEEAQEEKKDPFRQKPLFEEARSRKKYQYFYLAADLDLSCEKMLEMYNRRGNCENAIAQIKSQCHCCSKINRKSLQTTNLLSIFAVLGYNLSILFRYGSRRCYQQNLELATFVYRYIRIPGKVVKHSRQCSIAINIPKSETKRGYQYYWESLIGRTFRTLQPPGQAA